MTFDTLHWLDYKVHKKSLKTREADSRYIRAENNDDWQIADTKLFPNKLKLKKKFKENRKK